MDRRRDRRLLNFRLRQCVADLTELGIGVGADRLNGCQANDDDQSEHHGILNGSRAIFGDQKSFHALAEILVLNGAVQL